MGRKKLARFEFLAQSDIVVENKKDSYTTIKGNWGKEFFKNDNPIILELACGRGEYTIGMGKANLDKNYIGVDIKGDRIARGVNLAIENKLTNVGFLRAGIKYLEEFFDENEVDEIMLIHPDPQPLEKWEKKRLTSKNFLELYKKILKPKAFIKLKTDDDFLYEYSLTSFVENGLKVIESTSDLYSSTLNEEHLGISTYYERLFNEKGRTIKYIKAQLN